MSDSQTQGDSARQADALPRLGWLLLSVSLVYPLFAGLAAAVNGPLAWTAAALAALVCLLGAGPALLISARFRAPEKVLFGVLIGMFFRMAFPLAAAILVGRFGDRLRDAGFVYLLLGFYFVTLVVETLLSLSLVSKPAAAKAS